MAKSWAPWFGERYSRKPKPLHVYGMVAGIPVTDWHLAQRLINGTMTFDQFMGMQNGRA